MKNPPGFLKIYGYGTENLLNRFSLNKLLTQKRNSKEQNMFTVITNALLK